MSQAAEVTEIKQKAKTYTLGIAQGWIAGRIIFRRKIKTNEGPLVLTTLKLPAADAFSHPGQVELRSRKTIGGPGEDWSGLVSLTGFPNSFNSKPDEDGEITRIVSANNHFVVVEAED